MCLLRGSIERRHLGRREIQQLRTRHKRLSLFAGEFQDWILFGFGRGRGGVGFSGLGDGSHRSGVEVDSGSGVFAEGAWIGIDGPGLLGERLLHFRWVDGRESTVAGQETQHRHLVILVGVESQRRTMVPVWNNALIDLGNLDGALEPVGVRLREYVDQMPEQTLDFVYRRHITSTPLSTGRRARVSRRRLPATLYRSDLDMPTDRIRGSLPNLSSVWRT